MEAAEPVEPIRPITVRRGGLQQRQPSSTWASFAPSWIQSGIQTLKQSVFRPSDPSSQQDPLDSLLGKRSEPVDDRDPGPMPKRPRRESPPVNARTGSLEPRSSSIQRSVPLEATGPLPHARTPTLHYTQAAYSQATPQSNYLPNASTPRRHRLGALSARPTTVTFASNNAIPPRAASQVGLRREYTFQGYRAVSSGPSSGTDTARTSPSRPQSTVYRAKLASHPPAFGPNPVRTTNSGHVFGKGRSMSPSKPSLDRPAGTGWATGIVRTERERVRVGSFANVPYEATRPHIHDHTKLTLDPQVGIVAYSHRAPHMPMSNDSPHPPLASVTANGPAHRALNMLSEMSTPLSNARASPSLAPFTVFEIPPAQTRRAKVPIPASRAVTASKQKEVNDTIAALRAKARSAPYSTAHPSTTPSRRILTKRQEDEVDDNMDNTFELVVEPFKKGKENAKPTPSPGLASSPSATAAIVSPVEEKKEGKEIFQEQTQEATTAVRATTPSIRTAGTLKFPTGSLAGGAPFSGIRVAPSFRPTRETQFRSHAPAARIGGRFTANMDDDDDADEGAPTKEELEETARNVPAINVPVGFRLSFGKDQSPSTPPASTSTSMPLAPPTKHLVEAAVQASPAPEFKTHTAPAPRIVFTAPTAAPSPQPTPANIPRLKTSTPPTRDEEMESGSPLKESAPASAATPPASIAITMPSFPVVPLNESDKSKPTATKLFGFPAIGSTEASKTAGFTFTTTSNVEVPAPAPGSATSTGRFKFNPPTPTTGGAEPPKSAFPFGITPTPVPTPTEPKPASTPFIFGAPPQAAPAPAAAPSTIAPAATPTPDKKPSFSFIAPASTTPAETPLKAPSLFGGTPDTITPTNQRFSFNAPSSTAPSEPGSSPIKPDPVPGFPFTSAPAPPPVTKTPFTFGAPPGSNPGPDSRASTPVAPATGAFHFTLPGVMGVQPINNPFASKSDAVTNGTSTSFSFTNPGATADTPAKPFTFGAVPSTTPAGPPPSSALFQFGAPSSAPAASTAPFGAFGAGAAKKPVLQLDIDMDKEGATPPQEAGRSTPFTFGAPPSASNGGFGSAPPTAHPFGQTAPSSPFNAPRSATPFGAAPSTTAPFGQPPPVAGTSTGTGTGGFAFGAPGSSVSTPVTGTFPNLRAQTSSPAGSPFNPPAQLFGAPGPAPGTPTNFSSNLSEAGSDVGERRYKPLPKSRKTRTTSETRNALAKFHTQYGRQ